jgi:6-phosphogluconate dehydrogenase
MRDGLMMATIISYAQGLAMLHNASIELKMEIPLPDVVRIWRGGCINPLFLLELFTAAY